MVFDSNELLQKAIAKDAAALGELLEHYRPYLQVLALRYLDKRLQSRFDASDLVQVTFMEAHRDFPNFRGSDMASFLAWLRNMLRNNVASTHEAHLFSLKRNASREVQYGAGVASSSEQPLVNLVPSETTSPSQRVMRDEVAASLAISLKRLPETQAEAIRLRYLEGCSLRDIAERMSKSELAVAGLLKRGLRSLRDELVIDSESSSSQESG
jgi:RNA polymerase sigma-70 factor, ECF subfamily